MSGVFGRLQADQRQKVKLFWGTHDVESTAYKSIIPQWEAAGVEVVSVYSADGKGYVQDVFEKVCDLSFQQQDTAVNGLESCSSTIIVVCLWSAVTVLSQACWIWGAGERGAGRIGCGRDPVWAQGDVPGDHETV